MGKVMILSKQALVAPFESREVFVEFVKAPQGNEGQNTIGDPRWSNKDLEPTPESQRTWTWQVV